jgi:azurin
MKKHLIIPMLAGSLLLVACGKKEQSAAVPATPPAPAANAVAAFEVTASDTMKFNLTRLEVKAGQDVKITLTNVGNMPKAAMGHNLVILKKGSDAKAYIDAAVTAMATDYLPAALADQVLVHTKLLGPKQSDTISFKAPTEPGEYPFVCTFPAHYLSGMKGVLVVN